MSTGEHAGAGEKDAAGGPQRCHHEADAAHALFAAIAQMGLALRESQEPVSGLGALFARLAQILTDLRAASAAAKAGDSVAAATVGVDSAAAAGGDSSAPAAMRASLDQLQSGLFAGIQQLQFYDRLVQHLSHLQDYLIAVANELDSTKPRAQAREVWDEMHAKLRRRLISDEQRGLLDLFLSPEMPTRVSAQATRPDYSPPGSFEMF